MCISSHVGGSMCHTLRILLLDCQLNPGEQDKRRVDLPLGLDGAEEELGSISVGSSISHRQNTRASVLQGEVLILKPEGKG